MDLATANQLLDSRFEVVPSRSYYNTRTQASASIYGASPCNCSILTAPDGECEHGWTIRLHGFTVKNPHTNQVGLCRAPFETREEAETFAANNLPPRIGYGD